MKKLFVLVLLFAISACAGVPATPAQKVFAATEMYEVALSVAVAYKQLPSCEAPTAPKLCSDADVVETVQEADVVAHEALTEAQEVVRKETSTQSALQTAVIWAQGAIRAFSNITNSLIVK